MSTVLIHVPGHAVQISKAGLDRNNGTTGKQHHMATDVRRCPILTKLGRENVFKKLRQHVKQVKYQGVNDLRLTQKYS
jgi:hypothetical protein